MANYANIIVDISLEKLDKTFQYLVPEEFLGKLMPGMQVTVPFGKRTITGYVIELTDEPEFDVEKIKPIFSINTDSVVIEAQLIALAAWIRRNYGATMNQALKTVLPVKQKKKAVVHRTVSLLCSEEEALRHLSFFEEKHQKARARLLRELVCQKELDYSGVTKKLNVSPSVIRALSEKGILKIEEQHSYRNPVSNLTSKGYELILNGQQQAAVDQIMHNMQAGRPKTYLLKGVTGSGKTEVYMELIAQVIAKGKQAIVLIPEIALTYQTVMRFFNRFGDRVSIMNSRLSVGERYDQFLRAQNGDIDIMIGPRSALFAPFPRLGLIIMDEEHENAYKSETVPRYHAREAAIERARLCKASVVLGSATPSVDSYYQASLGNYELIELTQRANEKPLPECEVVDLRKELRNGNRSILSRRLQSLMEECLGKKQQVMLFLNRRGISGFISCRECGSVLKCPHCEVSLSQHNNGKMICHYCGYEEPVPKVCPSCGSRYIGGFKAGTQKVEQIVQGMFPDARILRMDYDTTRTKDSYQRILEAFSNQEADILIGTQMIVKGHDFSNVTLVGVLAADMSLHVSDFHASERTFQLLTQAAGRAGRGEEPGKVIIQTYAPDHFAIQAARRQDYEEFYQTEIAYRKLLSYPPVLHMLVIWCLSEDSVQLEKACLGLAEMLQKQLMGEKAQLIGPSDATISKIKDSYRKVIYIKAGLYGLLVQLKDKIEQFLPGHPEFQRVTVQFDFDPMSGF